MHSFKYLPCSVRCLITYSMVNSQEAYQVALGTVPSLREMSLIYNNFAGMTLTIYIQLKDDFTRITFLLDLVPNGRIMYP